MVWNFELRQKFAVNKISLFEDLNLKYQIDLKILQRQILFQYLELKMQLRSWVELGIDIYSDSSKKPLESRMDTYRNKALPQ